MTPHDLVSAAQDLVGDGRGAPRQANLRRAISTAYYALFHCLARCCADALVGTASANRSEPAWHQVYRALEHRDAAKRCEQNRIQQFPPEIQEFAGLFVDMQRKRHRADYASEGHWLKSEVVDDIAQATAAIALLERAPLKDRRAFAIYVLLRLRPGR